MLSYIFIKTTEVDMFASKLKRGKVEVGKFTQDREDTLARYRFAGEDYYVLSWRQKPLIVPRRFRKNGRDRNKIFTNEEARAYIDQFADFSHLPIQPDSKGLSRKT
jgi:hypothetical protein